MVLGTTILRELVYDTSSGSKTLTHALYYGYDEAGSISHVTVKLFDTDSAGNSVVTASGTFYYVKNLQGDVTAIVNGEGAVLVQYKYDAWGSCYSYNYASGMTEIESYIAYNNPFRYRGYYYDTETEFYYLNSRYYDPEIGRFLNGDVYISTGQGFTGYNMYVYCGNNSASYQQKNVFSSGPITIPSISAGDSMGGRINASAVKKIAKTLPLPKSRGFNLFGYESRGSAGWEASPEMLTGFLGRIGISSYVTRTQGQSGMLYAFAGSTSDVMNWFGTTYYAGVGINLFDIVGAEVQLENVGIGAQISIGDVSFGANVNLTGGTSITIGRDTDLGNGITRTKGFTIEVNTGLLVAAICWIYKLVTTGDPSPVPGLQPG